MAAAAPPVKGEAFRRPGLPSRPGGEGTPREPPARIVTAADVMSKPVVTVEEHTDLETVAKVMLEARVGSVVVVDEAGKARGIVTERDFASHSLEAPLDPIRMPQLWDLRAGTGYPRRSTPAKDLTAGRIMQASLWAVKEDDPIARALEVMVRQHVKHVPVLREGRPVGMLSQYDLLRMVQDAKLLDMPWIPPYGEDGRRGKR